MADTFTAKPHPLTCPFCEAHSLQPFGHNSARCEYCGGILGGPLLQTLQEIIKCPTPSVIMPASAATPRCGACPTGCIAVRPAARRFCPTRATTMSQKTQNHSRAYWYGWNDGRYGEPCCFTENRRLAELEGSSDKLDYYRGHHAGYETRLRDGHLREAS